MKLNVNRSVRKWVSLIIAIISYFLVHEGAHFIYAKCIGVFKQINFMSFGVQIDIYNELMTDTQMGIFCLVGAVTTIMIAYVIIALTNKIIKCKSQYLKAIMYYITIAFLLIDPIYLSVIYSLFGGGDMNGISLLISEVNARILFGIVAIINIFLFAKVVLPKYKLAFKEISQ